LPGAPAGASGSTTGSPGTLLTNPIGEAPPVEAPPPPAGPTHVQVTAEDTEAFRFVLSRPSVPAGKVILEFVNHGQDEHNLNAVNGEEVAGSIPNTTPNAHPTLTLTLHPGSYTLFCSILDHEAKGMKATLLVN
jgi:plastocyanin